MELLCAALVSSTDLWRYSLDSRQLPKPSVSPDMEVNIEGLGLNR